MLLLNPLKRYNNEIFEDILATLFYNFPFKQPCWKKNPDTVKNQRDGIKFTSNTMDFYSVTAQKTFIHIKYIKSKKTIAIFYKFLPVGTFSPCWTPCLTPAAVSERLWRSLTSCKTVNHVTSNYLIYLINVCLIRYWFVLMNYWKQIDFPIIFDP